MNKITNTTAPSVLIAHRLPLLAHMINNSLKRERGIVLAGIATGDKELLAAVALHRPQVVLSQAHMLLEKRCRLAKRIKEQWKHTRIIAIARHAEVKQLAAYTATWCAGIVLEDAGTREYAFAAREVLKRRNYFCRQAEAMLAMQKMTRPRTLVQRMMRNRGWEILIGLYCGMANKEIALSVGLTEDTIKTYRKKIKNTIGSFSPLAISYYVEQYADVHGRYQIKK